MLYIVVHEFVVEGEKVRSMQSQMKIHRKLEK